jgi:hypothetical protein
MSPPRVPNPIALLFVVASISACIIPVSSGFQDPPSSPNYAPVLESATPAFGSLEAVVTTLNFDVVATDPNLDDNLFFRWLMDYPPNTTDTRKFDEGEVPHTADGTALHAHIVAPVDCSDDPAPTPNSLHRLELAVADRAFVTMSPDNGLDEVDPPGLVVRANWTFQINCPSTPAPSQ